MTKHEQQSGQEGSPTEPIFAMRNIMDNQLESSDNIEIGRVADIEGAWRSDGGLILTALISGPEALAGRFSSRLRSLFHFFLHGRFEHCIPITEIDDFQPTLRLHGRATDYAVGQSDRWIANHIFRWIPGSGWRKWHTQQQTHKTPQKQERQREHKKQAAQPRHTHANRVPVRLEDLIGSKIVTAEGKDLGRVVDLHITREREPAVIALVYGESGWLYRLGVLSPFSQVFRLKFKPYTVPWQAVEQFERPTVTLKAGFEVRRGEEK